LTARLPVLVMVAAFSRFIAAVMIPSRVTGDLLAGMWRLLAGQIRAVPKRLLWDNEAGIGRGGRLAEGVAGWLGTVGTRLVQAKPFDPETKGIVERANGYVETSFLPGRSFTSPADFNTQLAGWLDETANRRLVRDTGRRPVDAVDEDRRAMGLLVPVTPACWPVQQTRLARDYYVRVASNDYSVDPAMIDRIVTVRTSLDTIEVDCQGVLAARHDRCWARRRTITDPAHVAQAAVLRQAFQQPKPAPPADDGLLRDLACYDQAFGVNAADLETMLLAEVA